MRYRNVFTLVVLLSIGLPGSIFPAFAQNQSSVPSQTSTQLNSQMQANNTLAGQGASSEEEHMQVYLIVCRPEVIPQVGEDLLDPNKCEINRIS